MSRRFRVSVPEAVAGVLSLVLVATSAHAQQIPVSQFERHATNAMSAGAAAIVPRDSVARYLGIARTQRRTGTSFVVVGLATAAASYAHFVHSGRMGMNGGQVAALAVGTGLGALGSTRWSAAHRNQAAAARWRDTPMAAAR